jgi:hypothetical protein
LFWKRAAKALFSTSFRSENPMEESGMLFLLLTADQWQIFSAIPLADQQPGGPVHRPIPVFDQPAALANNAGAVALDTFKEARRHATTFHQLQISLRQALITSIGPINESRLINPLTDILDKTCAEIYADMEEMYDDMTPASIKTLQNTLRTPLTSQDPETFRDFVTAFDLGIAQLTRAGQEPASATQFDTFVEACLPQPAAAEACVCFQQLHPTVAAQQLIDLQRYVLSQLRSTTVTAVGYANNANAAANAAVADPVAAAMISDLRNEIKTLKAAVARAARAGPASTRSSPPPFYCYFHGTCYHAGLDCTTMRDGVVKGVKTTFTTAMKKAKHPTDVPAGVPPGKA